jgi:hypothetical protein
MSNYNTPGWKIKPQELKDYTLVTPANRKNVVVMGRILYAISINGSLVEYLGYFVIRPRLERGRIKVFNHPHLKDHDIFINEDEDFNNYRESYDSLISLLIRKKQLYFKIKDQLVKHEKTKI